MATEEAVSNGKKVGGWLILFFVSVIAAIYNSIRVIMRDESTYENLSTTVRNVDIGTSILNIIFALIIFVVGYYLRKKYTPKLIIGYLWLVAVSTFISSYIITSAMEQSFLDLLKLRWTAFAWPIFVSILWTMYFLKSKRVKETFVN